MNQKMMETLLKSQISKLKKVQVEIEQDNQTKKCQILDQKIQQGSASFQLKDKQSGELFKIHFRL
ncbi:MAG: hypothetical protein GDA46_04490 [Bdellovibrionales bacterium]|nr:hypothetical protein [Bdellovibrionales bacterium]